jgi:hypothetical protein
VKPSISSNNVGERVGKSPVAELLEDVVGGHALGHLRKSRPRIVFCKPVKASISSNSGWERVGKSLVAELLEDVVGVHDIRHIRGARPGKISP